MESKIVGQLKPNEHDLDYFESEPFEIPYFDNKKIKVGFVEAGHQPYLEGADKVLQNFLGLNSTHRIQNSEIVSNCYAEMLKHGYTRPLDVVANRDIWNFVTPTEILIPWDENGDFYLCVSCECEWEEEHGLQLVFKNGETLTRASGHDGHFTD